MRDNREHIASFVAVIDKSDEILKMQFGLETEWDRPEKNIIGTKEADIEFDKILDQDTPKTTSRVYRSVRKLSHGVIPLVHFYSSDSVWKNSNNNIYPVVAVKFGRGFLIHIDLGLDEKR
jgi:hypothetical protein